MPRKKLKKTPNNYYLSYPYRFLPKHKYYCSKAQFAMICHRVNSMVAEAILQGDLRTISFPHNMGIFAILKGKPKTIFIPSLKRKDEMRDPNGNYYENLHSQRYVVHWHWKKRNHVTRDIKFSRNKKLYHFIPTKSLNTRLHYLITHHNYIVRYPNSI